MMASRGRYHHQEWEREEFDTTYDAQYPDEDILGGVQLDHCKLYVTNISRALNEEGLTTAFSKYGTLVKVHVSRDPAKRYALITYETPGEAKLAMMKLNKTEPLKLNINIAHKKSNQESRDSREDARKYKQREMNSYRDDASVSSKGRRKQDEFTNGNINDLEEALCDEDLGLDEVLDTELELELTQLRLKQLKLQQAQLHCKQQMLLLNKGKKPAPKANRCILPDGRIVVRNTSDKSDPADNTYSSAAGDSPTLPTLQHLSSRSCLSCGGTTDAYCGGCGLAPYCSPRCQQVDWNARHKYVCHNLACSSTSDLKLKETIDHNEPVVTSPTTKLRPPHSHKKDFKQDDNKQRRNFTPNNKSNRTTTNFKNKFFRRPNKQDNEESFDHTEPKRVQSESIKSEKPVYTKAETKPENQKSKPETTKSKPDKPADQKEPLKSPANVQDVTPKTKIVVPNKYVFDTVSVGDVVILSVDSTAADCRSDSGYICLALHETNHNDYQQLCEEFGLECEKEKEIDPKPGDLFAFFNHEDSGWYRARKLSSSHLALVDSSRVVTATAGDRSASLPPRYTNIPECCCQLRASVQLGDNLQCTLISKLSDGYKVSLTNAVSNAVIGEGEVLRWRPRVDYDVNKTYNASIPEVPRPSLSVGSSVIIVHCSNAELFVRPADPPHQAAFEGVLQDGLAAGMKAGPLPGPPRAGQSVLCRHTDGLHYRALCQRTNIKRNKYMIEFIDYGNTDITTLEKLSPCPEELELTNRPTVVSLVKLDLKIALNKDGMEYLEKLRDDEVQLVVDTRDKSASIPSGSIVGLTELKTKESVSKKLEEMCTPEWKKIEENGGDVVDCAPVMYSTLQYYDLPSSKCELSVLDVSSIGGGALGVCDGTIRHDRLLGAITEQIEAYMKSDLGKDPYLPKIEELCLAQCPPYPQYFRAVLCSHTAGSNEATVCYIDYNNVETVKVAGLRKMMPEFMTTPALACHAEIRGFPENPSDAQLARALHHMKIDEQGRGQLIVEKCERVDPGFYVVDAPGLLAAMME